MSLTARVPEGWSELAQAIEQGRAEAGLVFVASGPSLGSGWTAVAAELEEAFQLTQEAASAADPVVYVVRSDDLLGQHGPERAMVACGLLSGARTAAFEGAKSLHTANVLAVEEDSPAQDVARWVFRLLGSLGTNGELIHVGSSHLGRALP